MKTTVLHGVVVSLILLTLSGLCPAQNFPSPEKSKECWEAMRVAFEGQRKGELTNLQVAQYEVYAVKLCTRQRGENDEYTLNAMKNLALTYGQLGQHDKALEINEKLLSVWTTKVGAEELITYGVMKDLAITYQHLGQFEKSRALNEKVFAAFKAKLGEASPDTISSMNTLAIDYKNLGKLDKAVALEEKSLALSRTTLGASHNITLIAMNNIAVTYFSLGDFNKSLELMEKSWSLQATKHGASHLNTIQALSNLGLVYSSVGLDDKAVSMLEEASALMDGKLGEDPLRSLTMANDLARVYKNAGKLEKALQLGQRALVGRVKLLGPDHPDTLASMYSVMNFYSAIGQHGNALELNEKLLTTAGVRLGKDHPDTLLSMGSLASTYNALNQNDKALALIAKWQIGVEKLRGSNLSSENKQSLFAKYANQYQAWAKIYALQNRGVEGFNLADLSKARTLTDTLAAQSALRSLPPEQQATLQRLQAKGRAAQAQLDKLNESQTATTKIEPAALLAAQKAVEDNHAQYAALQAELKAAYPKYAQLTDLKPATAADAGRLLGAGEVFVSYLVDSKGHGQVFVLDAGGAPRWVDLGSIPNHAQTVAAYRELIAPSSRASMQGSLIGLKGGGYYWLAAGEAVPTNAAGASAVADSPSAALALLKAYWHDTLIKPILPMVNGYARWIISPDKDLALLPFDTLPYDTTASQTLAQAKQTTLVQSFAVYALLKAREADYAKLSRTKELFAMGNAVYDEGWRELAGGRGVDRAVGRVERNASRFDLTLGADVVNLAGESATAAVSVVPLKPVAEQYAISHLRWQNLPGTAREIAAVASAFSGAGKGADASTRGTSVDTYTGSQASESNFMKLNADGKLKDYRYMLFSAHGYLAQNPELSALVLSQKGNPEGVDGYITAAEWPHYDLRSDLTVLSACDTGVGKTQAGEGVMGLPYALFVAGNKNTLLTLWPVDDNATAEFMSQFFTKLKSGTPQPEALAQTKRAFMQHPQWSAPKYWAAFVLYGV